MSNSNHHESATVTIALPTTRIPHLSAGKSTIAAIIQLTSQRAAELLNAMKQISTLAARSSSLFRISSFEESLFYVAMADLPIKPAVDSFVVLPSEFVPARVVPVDFVHADIYPSSVCWRGSDEPETFSLLTSELHPPLLQLIASATVLEPGTSSLEISSAPQMVRRVFFFDLPKYRNPVR